MSARRSSLVALTLALAAVSCAASSEGAPPTTGGAPVERPTAHTGGLSSVTHIDSTVRSLDADGSKVSITYTDATGTDRTIRAELRLPDARPGADPLPVVVWSHGGSSGFSTTGHVGERWGQATNQAGHAFVAIAHTGRSGPSRLDVCDAIVADDCSTFNTLHWDRPHDVVVALDWIESIASDRGLDARRIVYGGHSAGAIGVATTAGAEWVFGSRLHPPSDPRPVGFIAASPPGVSARGVDADTLALIDRPILLLTGLGDTTGSTDAEDRIAIADLLPPDTPAPAVWFAREEARHGVFDLNTRPCTRAGGSTRACRTLVRTVARVGTEFVDALTRDPSGEFDADGFERLLADHLPVWAELR